MLIGLNKIPKISFMVAFATSLLSIVDPHTNSGPSLGLELGLGLGVRVGSGLGRVGAGVRVRFGFKDKVGVQSGQNFPSGTFGAHGASRVFGAHGRLRAAPLATNCWPEAPGGGGGSWCPRTSGAPPPPPRGVVFGHAARYFAACTPRMSRFVPPPKMAPWESKLFGHQTCINTLPSFPQR